MPSKVFLSPVRKSGRRRASVGGCPSVRHNMPHTAYAQVRRVMQVNVGFLQFKAIPVSSDLTFVFVLFGDAFVACAHFLRRHWSDISIVWKGETRLRQRSKVPHCIYYDTLEMEQCCEKNIQFVIFLFFLCIFHIQIFKQNRTYIKGNLNKHKKTSLK